MIIENVISGADISRALDTLSTIQWKEGLSFDQDYAKIKQNQELRKNDDMRLKIILEDFHKKIWKNVEFYTNALPLKSAALRFNRCADGGFYGKHADSAIMNVPPIRSDLSMTLFLTDDYEGGELEIEGIGSFKGKAGSIILYPSHYVHQVTPVTKGERICAVMWIQSLIQNQQQREFMADFYKFGVSLKEKENLSEDYVKCTSLYNNLLRMWSVT